MLNLLRRQPNLLKNSRSVQVEIDAHKSQQINYMDNSVENLDISNSSDMILFDLLTDISSSEDLSIEADQTIDTWYKNHLFTDKLPGQQVTDDVTSVNSKIPKC